MKSAAAVLALLTGIVAAQDQSKAFNLVISSSDKNLNGQKFSACHSGAAIESLCISGQKGTKFFLNTTEGSTSPVKGNDPSGSLIYNLPLNGGDEFESEPMSFYVDPSTNVALPLFEPGYGQQEVTFDSKQELGVFSYLDDTVSPPTFKDATVLKNWYVCQSYFTGYTYTTLNWVLGQKDAKPQNPSCTKVQVKRKYI